MKRYMKRKIINEIHTYSLGELEWWEIPVYLFPLFVAIIGSIALILS